MFRISCSTTSHVWCIAFVYDSWS